MFDNKTIYVCIWKEKFYMAQRRFKNKLYDWIYPNKVLNKNKLNILLSIK